MVTTVCCAAKIFLERKAVDVVVTIAIITPKEEVGQRMVMVMITYAPGAYESISDSQKTWLRPISFIMAMMILR